MNVGTKQKQVQNIADGLAGGEGRTLALGLTDGLAAKAAVLAGSDGSDGMPSRFTEVREVVGRVFGKQPLSVAPKEVKQLGRTLEKTIGLREEWRLPLLRELWSTLYAGAKSRRRSADHERAPGATGPRRRRRLGGVG